MAKTTRPRHRFLLAAALLAMGLFTSCGNSGSEDADTSTDSEPSSAAATPSAAEGDTSEASASEADAPEGSDSATGETATEEATAFPVTIEHAFGETIIEAEAQRVVTLGFSDHDVVLALGVEPVAIRQWYGDYDYVWPWAEEALGSATPELIPSAALNFEQIAALEPDLIIALYLGLEEAEYETLSAIAPTVAQSGDYPNFGTPWKDMTLTAGRALGRTDEAAAAIAEVEDLFATARAEHPEFEGLGLAYAGVYGGEDAQYYVETDGSTRMGILSQLGFVVPDVLIALGEDKFYHDISQEQLELLDQDIVLWEPANLALLPVVEENLIYSALAVSIQERDVFLSDPVVAGAMAHASVLSLPVVLEYLLPELARAAANLG